MWGYFIAVEITVLVFSCILLVHYAAPQTPRTALAVTLYAYLTSLTIVALVPIDVYSTLSHRPENAISIIWSIMYWSTQLLTWALVPVFQSFAISGAFNTRSKLIGALHETALFFGLMTAALLAGIIVLVASGNLRVWSLPAVALTLANAFGLMAGLLLLGYGLVLVPRVLWKRADPAMQLKVATHKAGQLFDKLSKSAARVHRTIKVVVVTKHNVHRTSELHPFIEDIWKLCEAEAPIRPSSLQGAGVTADHVEGWELDYDNDEDHLAKLRRRCKGDINAYYAAKSQYQQTVRQAWRHEQICKCRAHRGRVAAPGTEHPIGVQLAPLWWYECVCHPHVQRGAAVLAGALSVLVLWSEATIASGRSPDLSPFSHVLRSAGSDASTQLLATVPLVYIVVCSYFGLFHIGFFDYYHLTPGATDANSLLLNASLMCRFIPALCFNALHVMRMNNAPGGRDTVFARRMGGAAHEEDLPVLGAFNTWFPLLLVAHSLAIFFNVWEQIFGPCIPSRFKFSVEDADDNKHYHKGRLVVQAEFDGALKGHPMGHALSLGPDYYATAAASDAPPPESPSAAGDVEAGAAAHRAMRRDGVQDGDSILNSNPLFATLPKLFAGGEGAHPRPMYQEAPNTPRDSPSYTPRAPRNLQPSGSSTPVHSPAANVAPATNSKLAGIFDSMGGPDDL